MIAIITESFEHVMEKADLFYHTYKVEQIKRHIILKRAFNMHIKKLEVIIISIEDITSVGDRDTGLGMIKAIKGSMKKELKS